MDSPYNTLLVGKVRIVLDEVDSTNRYALDMLKGRRKPENGTVVVARNQFAGRGQFGNKWHGQAGKNLALSIVLYPKSLPVPRQFSLSQAVALGVCEFARNELGQGVSIKWPNDIYCNDRKLGGMLLQSTVSGNMVSACVAGIGLNINQTEFPAELPNPVSMKMLDGHDRDLELLVEKLCRQVELHYLRLETAGMSQTRRQYLSVLYRFRQPANYKNLKTGEKLPNAQISDVLPSGLLEITHQSGVVERFDFKEIGFL